MTAGGFFKSIFSARVFILIALAAGILGGKFLLIDRAGSDLPYWDQWDAEGDTLIRPLVEGRLTLGDLFAPHNEHRILFTRLAALGLYLVNDHQWDARLEMMVNAGWHAAFALLLASLALRILPRPAALAYAAIEFVFFTAPAAWENVLGGFQSQFYFLLLFSALHLAGTLLAPARSWRWWLAPLAGIAAIFSMGSGALSAAAILAVVALRLGRDRRLRRTDLWIIAPNLILVVGGWLLKVAVPGHDVLRTGGFAPWLGAEWHELAWPWGQPWAPMLSLLPVLILAVAWWNRRVDGPVVLLLLGAGIWWFLQGAALAYARGAFELEYASRYTDLRACGLLVNLLALGVLAAGSGSAGPRRVWFAAAALVAIVGIWGLAVQSAVHEADFLSRLPQINQARIDSVRSYLVSHDPDFFKRTPWDQLPYPSADRLAELLDTPAIRDALPASVRPPVPWSIDPTQTQNFRDYPETEPAGPAPQALAARYFASHRPAASGGRLITEPFLTDHDEVSLFVAGTVDPGDIHLALVDAAGDPHPPLTAVPIPSERWRRVNFIVPAGFLRLTVDLTEATGWFALTQPFTDTPLSRFAEKFVRGGPWLLALAAGFAVAALVLARFEAPTPPGWARATGPKNPSNPRSAGQQSEA